MKNFKTLFSIIFVFLFLAFSNVSAQKSTGINNANPSTKAALHIKRDGSSLQGIIIPKLGDDTTALNTAGLTNAEKGLVFYDSTNSVFQYWNGKRWYSIGGNSNNNSSFWTKSGFKIYPTNLTDSIGIGTSTPTSKLHVREDLTSSKTTPLVIQNNSNTANTEVALRLAPTSSPSLRGAELSAINLGGNTIDLKFLTSDASIPTEKMRLKSDGKLGIGTPSPLSLLEIAGSFGKKVTTTTTNLILNETHSTIVCNNAATTITITLPTSTTVNGRIYDIKKNSSSTGNVTIVGGGNIDGATSLILTGTNSAITIFSDGTEWKTSGEVKTSSGMVSSTGTANYLPIWANTSTLGTSAIQQETATTTSNVGIGGSPVARSAKLYVTGNGTEYGIWGESLTSGTTKTGLFGLAGNATTIAVGVLGRASGTSETRGVEANSTGSGTNAYGIYTTVTTGTPTNAYGIFSNVTSGTNKYAGVFMGGNVGIGNNLPQFRLDLSNPASDNSFNEYMRFGANNTTGGFSGGIIWKPNFSSYTKVSAAIRAVCEADFFRQGLAFYTGGIGDVTTDAAERMRIDRNGNMGIGTTTPIVSLDLSAKTDAIALPKGLDAGRPVAPSLSSGMMRFNTTSNTFEGYNGTAWSPFQTGVSANPWTEATGFVYPTTLANNIGIGISSPTNKLHVSTAVSNTYTAKIENTITTGTSGGALHVSSSGLRSIGNIGMLVQNLVTKTGGSNSTKIGLRVESTGAWGPATTNQPNVGLWVEATGADANYAAIFNSGSVGIGTSAPAGMLHVASTTNNLNTILTSSSTVGTWVSLNNSSVGGQWFSIINTGSGNGEGVGKLLFNRNSAAGTTSGTILTLDHATSSVGVGTSSPSTTLEIAGSFSAAYKVVTTANYTITDADYYLRLDNAASNVTLPNAANYPGRTLIIRKHGVVATHTLLGVIKDGSITYSTSYVFSNTQQTITFIADPLYGWVVTSIR